MTLQIKPFRSLRLPSPSRPIRSQQEGVSSKRSKYLAAPLWAIGSQHAPYYIYARMHARGCNIPNNIYAACIPFSVSRFHASGLLHIQSLTSLCTDGKTSSRTPTSTAHKLPTHWETTPIDKPRATRGIRFCMFRNLLAHKLTGGQAH